MGHSPPLQTRANETLCCICSTFVQLSDSVTCYLDRMLTCSSFSCSGDVLTAKEVVIQT